MNLVDIGRVYRRHEHAYNDVGASSGRNGVAMKRQNILRLAIFRIYQGFGLRIAVAADCSPLGSERF